MVEEIDWDARRTPEQREARKRMEGPRPDDWKEYRCKRHADALMVRTVEPDQLYCSQCMIPYTFDKLEKKTDK